MRVELIEAGGAALRVHEIHLDKPATIAEVLAQAGVRVPEGGAIGIHGHLRRPDEVLADGDRVEVYGPLLADPKQARRARVRRERLS